MKKICILIIIILNSFQLFSQIKVVMKDGKKFEGIPFYDSNDSLKIKSLDGTIHNFNKKLIKKTTQMVSKIELKNGREIIGTIPTFDEEHFNLQVQDSDTTYLMQIDRNNVKKLKFINQLNSNFGALGITLGTPGIVNLNYAYYYKKYGIRAGLGLKYKAYQFNFFLNLINTESTEIGLSLGFGHYEYWQKGITIFGPSATRFINHTYIGPFLHFNFYSVFFEVGMGHDIGGNESQIFLLQLGFMFKDNIF